MSLIEKRNYDCIFWSEEGCEVYAARPFQCRSFPFWSSIVDDREHWEEQGRSCPGINEGDLHSSSEIERWLTLKGEEDYHYLSAEERA